MTRLIRWLRGDIQIIGWIGNQNLNKLSKYKILDNLRRAITSILVGLNLIFLCLIKFFSKTRVMSYIIITLVSLVISSIIDIINYIVFRKENIKVQKKFTKRIDGLTASIYRGLIEIGTLPYKAYQSLVAIIKTIYRMKVSRKHLLEWTTAEEAEKQSKKDLMGMCMIMSPNIIFGIIRINIFMFCRNGNSF